MKSFLPLLLAIVFGSLSVYGQNLKLYTEDTEITTDTIVISNFDNQYGDRFLTSHFRIENLSDNDMEVGAKIYEAFVLKNAKIESICVVTCITINGFPYVTGSNASLNLTAGETSEDGDFHELFVHNDYFNKVSGIYRFTFYDRNNYTDSVSVVVKYNALQTGIDEAENGLKVNRIYPNPANQYVMFDYELEQGYAVIELFNLIGAKVMEFELNEFSRKTSLDVSDLQKGVYYVRFLYNGQVVKTEKLIINHN